MKRFSFAFIIGLLLLMGTATYAQGEFRIIGNNDYEKLDFEFINNLVIIPVKFNGVELSFLLDTGVKNTILFSLQDRDSLELKQVEEVRLRGLGNDKPIRGVKSFNNVFEIGKIVDRNHPVYIVFDQDVNFSTRLGKVVHGIIGYEFFKQFVVETNYVTNKMQIWKPEAYDIKRCRRCTSLSLKFSNSKPYINAEVDIGDNVVSTTLLLDSGSSDGLWLFEHTLDNVEKPDERFQDYLGLGLNGDIFGERTRVETLKIDKFTLRNVTTAFPDTLAIKTASTFKQRNGSIGAEVLRRFKVVIDYPNERILLRRNKNFSDEFNYDMSGLTFGHNGLSVVKSEKNTAINEVGNTSASGGRRNGGLTLVDRRTRQISYELKPQLVITNIRENSPASEAGLLKNDNVISVNGREAHLYSIPELTELFSSKENKVIKIVVERNGAVITARVKLKRRI